MYNMYLYTREADADAHVQSAPQPPNPPNDRAAAAAELQQ